MDLGAYNGDSIRALRTYAPTLARVIAMEPDRRNARKLAEYAERAAEETPPLEVTPIEAGAWSEEGVLYFDASGNRNANLTPNAVLHGATARMTEVKVNAPDAVALATWGERCVDHIKYDVEGAEAEALRGSRRLIERDRPALLVSAYHRSEDLFALPLLVHELCPSYRLYLRRMAGVPAWDINLYAVAE
jgi:FkbM family methyltransferase